MRQRKTEFRRNVLAITLAASFATLTPLAHALPQGGVVVAGQATMGKAGKAMTVTQTSSSATYNWQSFNIGKSESVHFQQPTATSVALNYVLGNTNSIIDGNLSSNGQLFLSNPNGILFGSKAQVNVAGLAMQAGNGQITNAGFLNVNGGTLTAHAGIISNTGMLEASSATQLGGKIVLTAGTAVLNAGGISANGIVGGSVLLSAGTSVLQMGKVQANGASGAGGSIALNASYRILQAASASTVANGATGGSISYRSGMLNLNTGLILSGVINANGASGNGGALVLTGANIDLLAAQLNASGTQAGGSISLGGGFQGKVASIPNAQKTNINATTVIKANGSTGNGGNVVVWSDQQTTFSGSIVATGGAIASRGGRVEVSGKSLGFNGLVNASAANGLQGSLLLDPVNLNIQTGAGVPSRLFTLSKSGWLTQLSNGNLVVNDQMDSTVAPGAGAVWLFNGTNGALISTLTGSQAYDGVGNTVTALNNGNYVVSSPYWDNGLVVDAGAATWGNGATGVTGVVSATNSLVGSTTSDTIGVGGITALSNGNYVVNSFNWTNGLVANVGAVTWGNGVTGAVGVVSAANSLVGSAALDCVGSGGITALSNGNYVVGSSYWDNGLVVDAGSATWGNGTTGVTGAVSAANSLVGSTASDQVGSVGVTALSNGNYVVRAPLWDNGLVVDAGSATWGSGTTGVTGAVSAANSLVGSTASDQVGSVGVTALSNGNYVVSSPLWDNGLVVDAGSATWGNGATGVMGMVSAVNSLAGSKARDQVGILGVTALSNGNYVVGSTFWDNGLVADAGAATWGNGATGVMGVISAVNSLVGSKTGDWVGSVGAALSNGNYVVRSSSWDNGLVVDAGAVTWGNGATGVVGVVSALNSLVGSMMSDWIGSGGVTALSNGNYVVRSPSWNNGLVVDAGAATWGNGATGMIGVVSAVNSLVGSKTSDFVGIGGVAALSNGNYVVSSPYWDNGLVANAGSATWGNGATGVMGVVSAINSLVGSKTSDVVGIDGIAALSNGNYVVSSHSWDYGLIMDVGAVTWGKGTTGISGHVTTANSLVGSSSGDQVGVGISSVTALTSGNYSVGLPLSLGGGIAVFDGAYLSPAINMMVYGSALGASSSIDPSAITSITNTGTAVTLQASNDISVNSEITTVPNVGVLTGGSLTLAAGRSVLINANINTAGGNLTLIANDLNLNGVVAADRAAGMASITQSIGTTINTGAGLANLELRSGGAGAGITLGNIATGTLNVNSSTGAITQVAGTTVSVLAATTLTANNGAVAPVVPLRYAITLANVGNNFVGAVTTNGLGVSLLDSVGGIILGNTSATGALAVTSRGGAITQAAATTAVVTGATTLTANNGALAPAVPVRYAITLANAGNNFVGAVTSDGTAINLTDGVGGIILGNTTATGTLKVTSKAGEITQVAATKVSATGATTLAANNGAVAPAVPVRYAITLANAGNNFVGAVTSDGTAINLTDGVGGIILGNTTATGTLKVTSKAGAITQVAATKVSATGATTLAANNGAVAPAVPVRYAITLANAGNNFVGAVTSDGTAINLTDGVGGIILGKTTATGTLKVTSKAGAITQVAATKVSATGATTLAANNGALAPAVPVRYAITLANAGNNFVGAVTSDGTAINLTDGVGGIILGNTTATGTLKVTSKAGAITQVAATKVSATGATTLTANNGAVAPAVPVRYGITLANATNNFGGLVTANGLTVTLADLNALNASVNATGATSLSAAGALNVAGRMNTTLATKTTGALSTTTFGATTVGTSLAVTSTGAVKKLTPATAMTVAAVATTVANPKVTVNGVVGALIP